MSNWTFFKRMTRLFSVTVMIVPVVLGTITAYAFDKEFNFLLFLLTLVGAVSAHIFSNMVNDLWDYRNGTDTEAAETEGAISTNSGFLTTGTMSEKKFAVITWGFLVLAAVCGLILTIVSGWPILVLALVGALIAYFYVAPPIKFGYRGKGYSEIGIFISFGVLPVLGAYYVQTGEFAIAPLLLSLPVGMLTTMLLFNHHFLHWRADREIGKKTLVVMWGEERALRLSKIMTVLAYVLLIVSVVFGALPVYGLLAVVSVIPMYKVYKSLGKVNPSEAYLPLMGASQQSSVLCGLIMCIGLLIQGMA
ncbi:prenyltransferase [Paenibacillus urinalis]|uniref:Prenyltransferase n=1 Tax=Paenibacillus urinalis TaxID=521520 RepID=A0AAX3N088_9BACL|nr:MULTISPECIES: prenyltransferase [Paenibacillus]WDH82504.1 prenyltransferase [Paenibacillus urinalis]WDH98559.1 prenyltransferase [Paenibacillus urinalis]WDI02251.1 prenyltransferase [Paenibacillus urinalis]